MFAILSKKLRLSFVVVSLIISIDLIFTGNIEFVGPICESSDKFLNQKGFAKVSNIDWCADATKYFSVFGIFSIPLNSTFVLKKNLTTKTT